MDIHDAATSFVEEAGHKFGKITVRDRANILRGIKAAARAKMVQNFADAGIDDAGLKYSELENFDRAGLNSGDLIAFANTADGQEEILFLSLRKHYQQVGEAEKIMDTLDLTHGQTIRLVAKLCGLEMSEAAKASEDGADAGAEENPTSPGEPKAATMQGYGS